MKLNSIAKNQTEVTLSNGDQVFFSYRTPVACYIAKKGRYARTDAWYSSTTTRHINKWLGNLEYDVIPQSYLDEITLKGDPWAVVPLKSFPTWSGEAPLA